MAGERHKWRVVDSPHDNFLPWYKQTRVESNVTMRVRLPLARDQPTQAWSWDLVVPRNFGRMWNPSHTYWRAIMCTLIQIPKDIFTVQPCSTRSQERGRPLRMAAGLPSNRPTRGPISPSQFPVPTTVCIIGDRDLYP